MLLTQQQTENVTNPPQNYEQNNFSHTRNMGEIKIQRKNETKKSGAKVFLITFFELLFMDQHLHLQYFMNIQS